MRRNPRKTKWTKAHRRAAGKDLRVDSTFLFEQKRNVPVKYDRDLHKHTINAMKRVNEIQHERNQDFIRLRLEAKKKFEYEQDRNELQRDIRLIEQNTVPGTKLMANITQEKIAKVKAKNSMIQKDASGTTNESSASTSTKFKSASMTDRNDLLDNEEQDELSDDGE